MTEQSAERLNERTSEQTTDSAVDLQNNSTIDRLAVWYLGSPGKMLLAQTK